MSSTKKTVRRVARRDEQKAELKDTIFAAARNLVLREGFAELSIRKLAGEIGYAPGTIYLYFKSRDEIVRAICLRGFTELYEEMKGAGNVPDPRRRLAALLRAYADFAIKNPESYRLSFMEDPRFTEEMFHSAPLEREDGPGWQAFSAILKAVRELKRSGKIRRGEDVNLLAELLWAGVHGVVSLKLIYPAFPTNPTELLVDSMIDTLLKGIH